MVRYGGEAARDIYLFRSAVWTRGHATDKKTWGTTSWGRGRRNRLKSVERGGETGGERRRCYHRCWIIEQCTPARSHIPTSIPTQFCPRYYCLLADCRVRSGGGKGGCAREDVSSRGSRGVNYFTILFEEARAWNLRNEIPRRLAETWLIFYRRPVYIYRYPIPPSKISPHLPTQQKPDFDLDVGNILRESNTLV